MPAGFLAVFSEPGSLVSLDEFQDWYDNEHIPLRLHHLPSFLTGARYTATDGGTPSWAAMYDIDSTDTFQHESYTRLRLQRSPREADLVERLAALDRRTYEASSDTGESPRTSSLKAGSEPTPLLVTHGLEDEKDLVYTRTAGWVRTRTFRCIDNLNRGKQVPEGPEAQLVPQYLVVHELVAEPDEFRSTIQNAIELRTWKLYKAYPCVAQGNLQ